MKDVVEIALPNVLVLIGWFVVYHQMVAMKKRDDLALMVEKSIQLIEEIYNLTIDYFSNDNIEPIGHESADIRSKHLLLSHYLMTLRQRNVKGEIGKTLNAYRQVTMGTFFENTRKSEQRTLPHWKSELANNKSELIFRLNQNFLEWCHPSQRTLSLFK